MEEIKGTEEIIKTYREDVAKLARYIPWLETKSGSDVMSSYRADQSTFSFPVYDGTLMSFVKEAQATKLMNRNYRYTYSRNHIKTAKDELSLIRSASIKEFGALCDILSKYVLGGMTRAQVWREGIENRIFLEVLMKLKDLIEFWDKPLA